MSGIVAGKLAFVTGAGSGIGRATCQVLAREGAKVIAADRNATTAQETIDLIKDSNNISIKVEVDQSASVAEAVQKVLDVYKKPPSIIVNCAGITRDNFLLKLSEMDFEQVINVNLKGTFLVMQKFANAMVAGQVKDGSIINLASIVGKYGNIGQTNYAASKAGVELMTRTASKEFAKFGIRCNTILPGFIETPMTDAVPDKVKAKIIPMIPAGRLGKSIEIAEVVAFLASGKSSYINGASIDVTGGF